MNFKKGDLIVERAGDSIYLILLTKTFKNKGHGYIIDELSPDEERLDEIFHTTDDRPDIYPIELDEAELIEKAS